MTSPLEAYLQQQQASRAETLGNIQQIGGIMGILTAQAQLEKAKREQDMTDSILRGGGPNGILSDAPPSAMRSIGLKLALAGHPGGATLVTAADKAEKALADRQAFDTMKSSVRTIQPDPQEAQQAADYGTPAVSPATVRSGGVFSTLAGSPYVGEQARSYQDQLDASKQGDPEQFRKHYDRLFAAHQLATENANKAAERAVSLPKSTLVVQDKSSPTGWSHLDTRTLVRIPGAPPPASAANIPSESIVPPQHKDLHGADYLSTLPPAMGEMVKGVAEGRVPLTAASMRFGNREALMQRVMQYDPAYNQQRPAVWKDFTSGKAAQNITAMNTVVSHLGTLDELTDALKNGNVQTANALVNRIRTETGKPEINNAEIAVQAVGNELMRVFRQVSASQHEVEAWERRFQAAKGSPEQLKGAIKVGVELLKGRLDAVNDQWKRGMGTEEDFPQLLSPKSSSVLQRITAPRQEAPQPSGGPKDGQRSTSRSGKSIIFRNGQWEYE